MRTYSVTDLVYYLRGRWDLVRDIVDERGADLGAFSGVAMFTPRAGGLRYDEQGELRTGNYRGTATRTLHYLPERAGRCTVWFDDGHFFHDLELDTGGWQVQHPCRQDLYYGWFEVAGPDRWRQHWRVAGPDKSYSMTTLYTRRADAE